jgi:hypothetical protein
VAPDQGSTSLEREYRAVIVGLRQGSGYIERVWVQNDGGLSDGGRVHYPLPGRSALGDAALVFGLSDPREFSITDLSQADEYAAELRRDLGGR